MSCTALYRQHTASDPPARELVCETNELDVNVIMYHLRFAFYPMAPFYHLQSQKGTSPTTCFLPGAR